MRKVHRKMLTISAKSLSPPGKKSPINPIAKPALKVDDGDGSA